MSQQLEAALTSGTRRFSQQELSCMGAKDLHRGDFVNLGTETKVLSVVGMRPQERASARKSHVSLTTFSGLPFINPPVSKLANLDMYSKAPAADFSAFAKVWEAMSTEATGAAGLSAKGFATILVIESNSRDFNDHIAKNHPGVTHCSMQVSEDEKASGTLTKETKSKAWTLARYNQTEAPDEGPNIVDVFPIEELNCKGCDASTML